MKKIRFILASLAAILSITSFAQVKMPAGRIAMTFDGNVEDDDDIIALPVSLAIIDAANLKSKLVLVEYNNNVCGGANTVQEDNNDASAFAGNDAVHMRASAQGMIDKYGFSSAIFFDYTLKAAASQTAFISEINKSTSADPLFIIAAGPMETLWRALNASDKTKHKNVFVISHSGWNQNYATSRGRCSASSHDWAKVKNDFPDAYYVESGESNTNPKELPDQNAGLSTPINQWDWMKNDPKATANTKWMNTRNPFNGKFDPSDAGMVYYLVTGGPLDGGKKRPSVTDVKNLLLNPIIGGGNQAPTVSISAPANNASFVAPASITITANATDQDGTISKVEFFNGSTLLGSDVSAPYTFIWTGVGAGNYTLTAKATDNSNAVKTSAAVSVTVAGMIVGISDIADLKVVATVCPQIKLTWSDVSGETGYRIRRKTPTSNFIVLADVPANTTSYIDETALENTTYQYMVRPMQSAVAVAVSNTPEISTAECTTDPIPVDTYLKAFPNPTTGILTLPEVLANDQIKVVSQQSGLTVFSRTIQQSGSTQLDISNQPAGNYTIQLVRNNQLLTRQIIKL
jgi:hypothetical protein